MINFTPPLSSLLWCWYWQAQLHVHEEEKQYILTLPNHRQISVEKDLPASWQYSGECNNLHPATYATEEIWQETVDLEWRRVGGDYILTKLLPKRSEYKLPVNKVPDTNHLAMTYLLRQGYRIEEQKGIQIIVHTPKGAWRQVQMQECSCGQFGMCIHKQLSLYYFQYRQQLRKYPELAKDALGYQEVYA